MTLEEFKKEYKAHVVKSYEDGKSIQFKLNNIENPKQFSNHNKWERVEYPTWDWELYTYRVGKS